MAIAITQSPSPQTSVPHGTGYLRFVSATTGRVFQVKQARVKAVRDEGGLAVVELAEGLVYPTVTPWELWCGMECFARDVKERHPHFLRNAQTP